MRNNSPITYILNCFALFSAIFAAYSAAYATGVNPGVLANLSSRAQVLTGDNVVIAGFVITGSGTKTVVIRGLGPSLIGLTGVLADPTLSLHDSLGNPIYSNDNWRDTQQSQIQATGLQPSNDLESAIIWTLYAGSYTATLAGNNGGTGLGLVEVYDTSGSDQLANLSTRALVGVGDNVLIAGLIARSTTSALFRAIGPSLSDYGVTNALQNPTLELHDGYGALIASNDNWQDTQALDIQATGLAPTNRLESAILTNLAPGTYSAIVQGVNNTTGVGIVEVYALPDTITFSPNPYYSSVSNNHETPTINCTSAINSQIWASATNSAQGGSLIDGTTHSPGSYSAAIPIPGWAYNGQQFYVVDASLPNAAYRPYRAKVTFAVTPGPAPAGSYPRIFQAWNAADNLNEDPTATLARHDLVWHHPPEFGWNWVDDNGAITQDYHSERIGLIGNPVYSIPTARSLNPNIKILAEIDHYALPLSALGTNDPWWLLVNGQKVLAWPGGDSYKLNEFDPSLQAHVATRARIMMATGQFDGVFLDVCWPEYPYHLPLIQGIRQAIGDLGNGPLIVVNANDNRLSSSVIGYINGVFMESETLGNDWTKWQTARDGLIYNETHTRIPRVNCFESSWINSRNEPSLMRATTCMALTYSYGYALFDDPNYLPAADHLHNWYHPFWSNYRLGIATSGGYAIMGAQYKDFQNGTAVWNPVWNGGVTVTFTEMRTSQASGTRGTSFSLPTNDGDIYTR
jgi:hypothetical protein